MRDERGGTSGAGRGGAERSRARMYDTHIMYVSVYAANTNMCAGYSYIIMYLHSYV